MLTSVALVVALSAPLGAADGSSWCGTRPDGAQAALSAHRYARAERQDVARGAASALEVQDAGHIAVLVDAGDLVIPRNAMDLGGAGLEFTPTGAGYRVARVDRAFDEAAGTPLALGDDASIPVPLPFSFPYYGAEHATLFVNSDGNLTFGRGDNASTSRDLQRMVSGAPRIAPLFADFDPAAGGSIETLDRGDRFTVTWRRVPQWGEPDTNDFQVTLRADGAIEFTYGTRLNPAISQGVVGLAPGAGAGGFARLDMSNPDGAEGAGALLEAFADTTSIDAVATAQRFYATHGDDYDQLIVYSSRNLAPRNVIAWQLTVRNAITGIGDGLFDFGPAFGSPERLQSFVLMDSTAKYREPFDVTRVVGEATSLSLLAHEVGHRWLASARYLDAGTPMDDILSTDLVHWSFFFDSDASHDDGNDIEDAGGGTFRTVGASLRYGALDQYLMGLRAPAEVGPLFVVRDSTRGGTRDGDPQTGVEIVGTRHDFGIEDVIAANGPRAPAFGEAPREWRQAWVFVSVGEPDPAHLEKVERLRQMWPAYYVTSTEGRGSVVTELQ